MMYIPHPTSYIPPPLHPTSYIQVAGPIMYGSLFALGCRLGVPALPFYFAATVGLAAWLLVLLSPSSVWRDAPAPLAKEAQEEVEEQQQEVEDEDEEDAEDEEGEVEEED